MLLDKYFRLVSSELFLSFFDCCAFSSFFICKNYDLSDSSTRFYIIGVIYIDKNEEKQEMC